jgi:ribosome assembly protein YihI (activator of Der GTPase)
MPRKKKSRKVGLIGVPLAPKAQRKPKQKPSDAHKKARTTLGKPSGTRNNPEQTSNHSQQSKGQLDPRIGSKKPIPLIVDEKPEKTLVKPTFFSPAKELESIEQNERFNTLLDNLDSNQPLTREEQAFVNKLTQRHKELCGLLGVTDDESEEPKDKPLDDLYAQFEAIDINKLK